MEILKIIITYLIATIIFILVLLGVIFLFYIKIFKKQNKKKELSIKDVKKVIFRLKKVVEDIKESPIKMGEEISYTKIITTLRNLENDDNITEIIIDTDNIEISDVHIEELSYIFKRIRKKKKITAIASELNIHTYKIALLADKILMLNSRQSSLTFRGYRFQDFYIAKLLSKIGISINVLHIGDYKVAGENLHLENMTEERKKSLREIGEEGLEKFIELVKCRRNIDISEKINEGDLIFLENENIKEIGLIDGVYNYEEFEKEYNTEEDTVYFEEYMYRYKRKKNKSKNIIAVFCLEGVIKDKSINSTPYISYDSVREKMENLKKIENLKGVVIRINSPGGSAVISEKIYQKLKTIEVPVYVSMGSYCASGGYYIASVGEKLFANVETLTGSIGVVLIYPEIKNILDKNNIKVESVSRGKGFDIFNSFEKLSMESKSKIELMMKNTYKEFKDHIIEARKISEENLEKIAGGRVWLGSQAVKNSLVDEIGTLEDCIESLVKKLELNDYKIEYVELKKSIKEMKSEFLPKLEIISNVDENLEEIDFIYKNKETILYYENIKKEIL